MVMSTLFDYGFGVTSVSSQAEVEPGPCLEGVHPMLQKTLDRPVEPGKGRVLLLAKTKNSCGSPTGMPMDSKIGN